MDNVVLPWLLGTIIVDLQETTRAHNHTRNLTAQQLWVALEEQFLGNCKTRALHLDAKFWLFVQGGLGVDNHCRKMKRMADDLCNLDEHVEDHTLVLNVLRGLNKKYHHVKMYLKRARPFPSFHNVCNDLFLEELTLDVEASSSLATALAA
jgi:hypothetical protein